MKEVMREVITKVPAYIADDGREFATKYDCEAYEKTQMIAYAWDAYYTIKHTRLENAFGFLYCTFVDVLLIDTKKDLDVVQNLFNVLDVCVKLPEYVVGHMLFVALDDDGNPIEWDTEVGLVGRLKQNIKYAERIF